MKIHSDIEKLPQFEKSIITIGSFDGVHHGHQRIIEQLQKLKEIHKGTSVVITFHPHPRQVIYPKDHSLRLLTTLEEKIDLFQRLKIDHLVLVPFSIEFSQWAPREYIENFLIKKFNPKCIVIGYDHRFGLNRAGNLDLLKSYEEPGGLEIIEIDKQVVDEIVVSSTKIRRALEDGKIHLANQLLDHDYSLSGQVIHGQKMGSQLGYPTANVQITDPYKLIPKEGIYAASARIEDDLQPGLLYIGSRPSFKELKNISVEMHIFDFDISIYHENLTIHLHKYIREDQRFEDLEDLKVAMQQDEIKAKKYFEQVRYDQEIKVDVAVAILNYNGESFLDKFLPSFITNCPGYADIYVIDNASTDGSLSLLKNKFPEIKLIQLSQNQGFAGGYNQGLKFISARYYYLINSDVEVQGSWIDPLFDICEADKTIAACQPKVMSYSEPEKFEYAGGAGGFMDRLYYPFCMGRILHTIEIDQGFYDTPQQIFWTSGAAMFVRADLFDGLGGFDASYFAHQEEIDLCWRIKRAGFKIMSSPTAKVFHVGGGTLTYESPRKTYLNFRNNLKTIYKNVSTRKFFKILPIRFILDVAAAFNYLAQGQFRNFIQVFKGYIHFLWSLSDLQQSKKKYNQLIDQYAIDKPNMTGRYQKSVLLDYYLNGKKTFSAMSQEAFNISYESGD